jgi:hypothetical protein
MTGFRPTPLFPAYSVIRALRIWQVVCIYGVRITVGCMQQGAAALHAVSNRWDYRAAYPPAPE